MKNNFRLFLIIVLSIISSCENQSNSQVTDEKIWKLGWRMIESSMDENFKIAELQFDSLLNISDHIDRRFLVTGLEIKSNLHKPEEVDKILGSQNEEVLREVCKKGFLSHMNACKGLAVEKVKNESLQMELIGMYIEDQAARGNIMHEIIEKYGLDADKVTKDGGVIVDERNRNRLKEIFKENGFPNKEQVGKDAMQGVFLIIQHSDADKDWQKSQLKNIEMAVKNGDMDGQSYAYLYDRIKINRGEKQLYGTQFSNVDPATKTVELADTEDVENLDKRRREVGMMPIEMYKRFMLRNLEKEDLTGATETQGELPTDSISNAGYNELANIQKRETHTISEYNTDKEEIGNVNRPEETIIRNLTIDTANLFGIWVQDPDGPHADFRLNAKSFYVVDYAGNGNMPYILDKNEIEVFYNDFIQKGTILSAGKDTLKIKWNDIEVETKYVKFEY